MSFSGMENGNSHTHRNIPGTSRLDTGRLYTYSTHTAQSAIYATAIFSDRIPPEYFLAARHCILNKFFYHSRLPSPPILSVASSRRPSSLSAKPLTTCGFVCKNLTDLVPTRSCRLSHRPEDTQEMLSSFI